MKINNKDIEIINLKTSSKIVNFEELNTISNDEIMNIIDELSCFIGYDSAKQDIDDEGAKIDNIISKLLFFLESRNDM